MMRDRRFAKWLAQPWWPGLGVSLMGLLWLDGASGIESTTNYVGLGPQAIVYAVGLGLAVLGPILIVQALCGSLPAAGDQARESGSVDADASPSRPALLLTLAAVALPLLTIRWLGFPLTAMLVFALVTRAFGSVRTGLDLALGALLGSLAWFGFSRLGISLGAFLPLAG